MTINRRLLLPLSLVGRTAQAAALSTRLRRSRRCAEIKRHGMALDVWESEGGKLVLPSLVASANVRTTARAEPT